MLDAHCHLDRYKDPMAVGKEAGDRGVFTLAVTHLPSHFRAGHRQALKLRGVRLAVGLHPLAAESHAKEQGLFLDCLEQTSYVGEVGLDFSREGIGTRRRQLDSFRLVATSLARSHKVVSLHSRGAEAAVLDAITEAGVPRAIFHWYTGSLPVADEAVTKGHLFSVNPAMVESPSGRRLIARIPPDRILSETDGPYSRVKGRASNPWDVSLVEQYLASEWGMQPDAARARIWDTFRALLSHLGLLRASGAIDRHMRSTEDRTG